MGIAYSTITMKAIENPSTNEMVYLQNETTSQIYTQNTIRINEGETIFSVGRSNTSWALLNLLCPAITILLGYALIFRKYEIENYHEWDINRLHYKNRLYYTCVLIAIFSILSFVLTENINKPMVIVDQWTIFMMAFPTLQFTLFVFSMKYKKTSKQV